MEVIYINNLNEIRDKKKQDLLKKYGEEIKTEKTDKPYEITDDTFTEFVEKHNLAVVDCWAPWCAPCRMVGPIIDELAMKYAGKISFGKLNIDENQKTAIMFNIMSIPTILVFKDGDLADSIIGALPKQLLEQTIKQYL